MAEYLSNVHGNDQVESINKIRRFPVSMREFCRERDYIVPKAVAIGPYHRGLPELQEMEQVKEDAAHVLFGQSLPQAYTTVFDVAGHARSCYDTGELHGIRGDAFASMMFHDACFLMLTILAITDPIRCNSSDLIRQIGANITVLLRDIFLLENQIPWVVLKALTGIKEVHLPKFIAAMGMNVQSRLDHEARPLVLGDYEPPHLLGLFHFYQSGRKITCAVGVNYPACQDHNHNHNHGGGTQLETLPLSSSAIELAEIGIFLTPSKSAEFRHIGLKRGRILFRKLFLPSLHLNENTACWLLNMTAFETCVASHHCTVSSYLALFAMLMDREEDVHELRRKHLIHGEFTDNQVLNFFKGRQASNIRPGSDYDTTLRSLERYRQKRRIRILLYWLVYRYFKIVFTVLSITGILVTIVKAIK